MSLASPKLASPGLRRALIAAALLGSGGSWASDKASINASGSATATARAGEQARAGATKGDDRAPRQSDATTPDEARVRRDERSYAEVVQQIEARRRQLASSAPIEQAERALQRALVDEILPRWIGVPWSSGAKSVARQPEPSAAVHCASFVIAALEGAGVRFAHRAQLAQAPALRILEAVTGEGGIARWRGTVPALERELLRRGPGVYLLGLSRHIGFAVVGEGEVRLVHASRTSGAVVVEPMARSRALARAHGTAIFAAALLGARDREPEENGERAVSTRRGKASGDGDANPLVRRWLAGVALGPS